MMLVLDDPTRSDMLKDQPKNKQTNERSNQPPK